MRPSLARRVLIALVLAFFLVWVVLVVRDYREFRQAVTQQQGLTRMAQALAESIDGGDVDRARAVFRAADIQFNRLMDSSLFPLDGGLLLRLDTADGTPVYASSRLSAVTDVMSDGRLLVQGQPYRQVSHETPQWRIELLQPDIPDRFVLGFFVGELLPSLAIAFPLVLLPLWIGVKSGLKPLSRFANEVRQRDPQDLTPLRGRLEYAELQPIGDAFDALLSRARKGIERERALLQDAAHELRTPLAVISAQAHVLDVAADEATRQAARTALTRGVDRAAHLVQQLLTLAAMEHDAPAQCPRIDLVALTRDILIALRPAAQLKDMEITLDGDDPLITTTERSAFHSIVENLVSNAIAYCPAGSRVELSLLHDADAIHLCVADNGPGIAPEVHECIFERFWRGRGVEAAGSGLGLAIVQRAVSRLDGQLSVTPGLEGAGVAFRIRLPLNGAAGD